MTTFLFKTEPGAYSFGDLRRDGGTTWTGVSSPAGLLALRACRKGDDVLIYHTGAEKRIVGLARVVKEAYPDPSLDDERRVVVDIRAVREAPHPVTLAAIKADKRFASFALVKQSRLSVMEVPAPIYSALRELAGLA